MSLKQSLDYWRLNFQRAGILPELIDEYIDYIEILLKNNVPIIFDFKHLCLLLGRNEFYIASVINSSNNHYREFQIPKRNGGKRTIKAPYPTLLECQRWIHNNILKKAKIHSSAHGFTLKKSIITHAKVHVNKEQLLKIDLKDFFSSIEINSVINVFKEFGYSHKVSFYLASMCCLDNALPQGAPTSPMLSNIVAKSMDNRLLQYARRFNFNYSRYADDLAFSGSNIPAIHIKYISNILNSCGFTVNNSKTILYKFKRKRILTGISIADSEIKIPRSYKSKLRQEIHYIRKYGLESHMKKNKIRKSNYLHCILGKISFWLSVEPDNKFAMQARIDLEQMIP